MEWQKIETAPKDRYVILYRPTAPAWLMIAEGKWDDQAYHKKPRPFWYCPWAIAYSHEIREHAPSHWMSLPKAPE